MDVREFSTIFERILPEKHKQELTWAILSAIASSSSYHNDRYKVYQINKTNFTNEQWEEVKHILKPFIKSEDNDYVIVDLFYSDSNKYSSILFSLPAKGGPYYVTKSELTQWKNSYPEVNVYSEFQKMLVWLNNNPKRIKTMRGMKRFITTWLERTRARIKTRGKGSGGTYSKIIYPNAADLVNNL